MALNIQGYTATTQENGRGRSLIFRADSMGAIGQFRIKWQQPFDEKRGDTETSTHERLQDFRQSIEVQRRMGGDPHWAPIVGYGVPAEGGEVYVSSYYKQSATEFLKDPKVGSPKEAQRLLAACVNGLLALRQTCNRGHGKLTPDNILVGAARPKGGFDGAIVLTDPVGEPHEGAARDDLRNLGALLYFLVMHRAPGTHVREQHWSDPAWQTFAGDQGDAWAKLCQGMLETTWSLETVQTELAKLKPSSSKKVLLFAPLCLLAVGIVIWLSRPEQPIDLTKVRAIEQENHDWFAAWATLPGSEVKAIDEIRKGIDLHPGDSEFLDFLDAHHDELKKENPARSVRRRLQKEAGRITRLHTEIAATRAEIKAMALKTKESIEDVMDLCAQRGWTKAATSRSFRNALRNLESIQDGRAPPKGQKGSLDLALADSDEVFNDLKEPNAVWGKLEDALAAARATGDPFLNRYSPGAERFAAFSFSELAGEIEKEIAGGDVAKLAAFIAGSWANVNAELLKADPVYEKEDLSASAWLRTAKLYLAWAGVGPELDALESKIADLEKQIGDLEKLDNCKGQELSKFDNQLAELLKASAALKGQALIVKNRETVEQGLSKLQQTLNRFDSNLGSYRVGCAEDAGEWLEGIRAISGRWSLFLNDEWADFKREVLTDELAKVMRADLSVFDRERKRVQKVIGFFSALHSALPYTCEVEAPAAWKRKATEEMEELRDVLFRTEIEGWDEPDSLDMETLERNRDWRKVKTEFTETRDELCRFLASLAGVSQGLENGYGYTEPMDKTSIKALFEPWLKNSRLSIRLPRGLARFLDPIVERALELRDVQTLDANSLLGMLEDNLPPELLLAAIHHLVLQHQFPAKVRGNLSSASLQRSLGQALDAIEDDERRGVIKTRVQQYVALINARTQSQQYVRTVADVERSSKEFESECGALRQEALDLHAAAQPAIDAFEEAVVASSMIAFVSNAKIPVAPFSDASLLQLEELRRKLHECGDPCRKFQLVVKADAFQRDAAPLAKLWSAWIADLGMQCDSQQREACRDLTKRLQDVKDRLLGMNDDPGWALPGGLPAPLLSELSAARQQHIQQTLQALVQDATETCGQVANDIDEAFARESAKLRRVAQRASTNLRALHAVRQRMAMAAAPEEVIAIFAAIPSQLDGYLQQEYHALNQELEPLRRVAQQSLNNLRGETVWNRSATLAFAAWRRLRQEPPPNIAALSLERETILPALEGHLAKIDDADQKAKLRDLLPNLVHRWQQTLQASPAEIATLLAKREDFGVSQDLAVSAWKAAASTDSTLLLNYARFGIPPAVMEEVVLAALQPRLRTLLAHEQSSPAMLQVALRSLLDKHQLPKSAADASALRAGLDRVGDDAGLRAIVTGRLQNAEYLRLNQELAEMAVDVDCATCEGACPLPELALAQAEISKFEQATKAYLDKRSKTIPSTSLAQKLDAMRHLHSIVETCSNPCKRVERMADAGELDRAFSGWSDWVNDLKEPCANSNPKQCAKLLDALKHIHATLRDASWALPANSATELQALRRTSFENVLRDNPLTGADACGLAEALPAKFASASQALQRVVAAEQQIAKDLSGIDDLIRLGHRMEAVRDSFTALGNSQIAALQTRKATLQQEVNLLNTISQTTDMTKLRNETAWAAGSNASVFHAWRRLVPNPAKSASDLQRELQTILPELRKRAAVIRQENAPQGNALAELLPSISARWQSTVSAANGAVALAMLRQHAEFAIPQADVKAAWKEIVSRAGSQTLDLLSAHEDYFVPRSELADWMLFDLELQGFRNNLPEDEDALRTASTAFIGRISGYARGEVQTLAAGLRETLADQRGGSGDLSTVGPATKGWSTQAEEGFVTYQKAGHTLAFRQVEPAGADPAFLCTSELSVGLLCELAKSFPVSLFKLSPLDNAGPFSWVPVAGRPAISPAWVSAVPPTTIFATTPGDHFKPTAAMPAQYLTKPIMDAILAALGCRYPTVAEWQGAPSGQAAPNLRDPTWLAYTEWAVKSPLQRQPAQDDMFGWDYGHAVASPQDNYIWFRETKPGSRDFVDLVGNVAEYVTASPNSDSLKIIGGSGLSPPAVWDGNWNAPKNFSPQDDGVEDFWYSDVGLRLAFSAPQASLISKIRRLLKDQPYLAAQGTLSAQ